MTEHKQKQDSLEDRRATALKQTPPNKPRVLLTRTTPSTSHNKTQTNTTGMINTRRLWTRNKATKIKTTKRKCKTPGGRKVWGVTSQKREQNPHCSPLADEPSSRSTKESGGTGRPQEGGVGGIPFRYPTRTRAGRRGGRPADVPTSVTDDPEPRSQQKPGQGPRLRSQSVTNKGTKLMNIDSVNI